MADSKSSMESLREWVVEHKLRAVGCLWISGIAGSIAYNWARPTMKTSVKLIHASILGSSLDFVMVLEKEGMRVPHSVIVLKWCLADSSYWGRGLCYLKKAAPYMNLLFYAGFREGLHAQALTLAALAGAAAVEYFDRRSVAKTDPYPKFLPIDNHLHKS